MCGCGLNEKASLSFREPRLSLRDISEAIEMIEDFTSGMDFEAFRSRRACRKRRQCPEHGLQRWQVVLNPRRFPYRCVRIVAQPVAGAANFAPRNFGQNAGARRGTEASRYQRSRRGLDCWATVPNAVASVWNRTLRRSSLSDHKNDVLPRSAHPSVARLTPSTFKRSQNKVVFVRELWYRFLTFKLMNKRTSSAALPNSTETYRQMLLEKRDQVTS